MKHGKWYYFVKNHSERAKTFGLAISFTEQEWVKLMEDSEQACACCKAPFNEITISADHVIPLACGGTNTINNIQILCKRCNSQKSTKAIDYRGSSPVVLNVKRIKERKKREPVEPKIAIPLRLPIALYEYFEEYAKKNKRSVNTEILIAMEEKKEKIEKSVDNA